MESLVSTDQLIQSHRLWREIGRGIAGLARDFAAERLRSDARQLLQKIPLPMWHTFQAGDHHFAASTESGSGLHVLHKSGKSPRLMKDFVILRAADAQKVHEFRQRHAENGLRCRAGKLDAKRLGLRAIGYDGRVLHCDVVPFDREPHHGSRIGYWLNGNFHLHKDPIQSVREGSRYA